MLYEASYFGSGEWDSRDAMLVLDTGGGSWTGPQSHNLAYLASITPFEHHALAQAAFYNLRSGWWCGVDCDQSCDHDERHPGHTAVSDFLERCRRGHWSLTEGMARDYADDIAGELRILRGWCIHEPWDKHEVGPGNPMMVDSDYIRGMV